MKALFDKLTCLIQGRLNIGREIVDSAPGDVLKVSRGGKTAVIKVLEIK